MTIQLSAWVNTVAWNPTSSFCYIATHDAVFTVVNNNDKTITTINLTHSPFNHIVPQSNTSFVGVGFDRHIYLYEYDADKTKIELKNTLTKTQVAEETGPVKTGVSDIMKRFDAGQKKSIQVGSNANNFKHIHPALINSGHVLGNTVITSDYAGFIKTWNL